MNDSAGQKTAGASGGVLPCQKKAWFAVSLTKVDAANKETAATEVTLDLNVTGPGDLQRVTATRLVTVSQLAPGGTGKVLQMSHSTAVYEAIGDFS